MKTPYPLASKESEMMVIGSMLTSINAVNAAVDLLTDSDFYFPEHKRIFRAMKGLHGKDKPIDVHFVYEYLKKVGWLEEAGGLNNLMALAQYAGTSAYIEEYAKTVKDKATLRAIVEAGAKAMELAIKAPDNVIDTLDTIQQSFFQIGRSACSPGGNLIGDILSGVKSKSQRSYLEEIEERRNKYQTLGLSAFAITGLLSHYTDLDSILNGFNNSNLMILAARPSMGKTALAMNIAENICFRSGKPVGVFSLEMSSEQLILRMISAESGVEAKKITTGSMNDLEYQKIVQAIHHMQECPLFIEDQSSLNIADIRSRARRMKEAHKIELLIIDYLQLISGSTRNAESRQVEISEISRMLKHLARDLDIPILCLSQLSRKVEERQGNRPVLSDIRESGSIEQDADIVMFLYRAEYYNKNNKPGQAELIVAKNRHGPIGSVNLTYLKETARFENYTPLKSGFCDSDS